MAAKKGLGKGLDSLIADKVSTKPGIKAGKTKEQSCSGCCNDGYCKS